MQKYYSVQYRIAQIKVLAGTLVDFGSQLTSLAS